jgi:predicted alpha/beta hydrolase family esterase
MSSAPQLILAPQWAGTPTSDFYPWLVEELSSRPRPPDVRIVPPPERPPTPESYRAAVDTALGELSDEALRRAVLVGHSVGSHALLQALAQLEAPRRAGSLVVVAGWWDISRDTWASFGLPWEQIQRWLDVPLDDDAVRAHVAHIDVIVSEGDRIPASSAADTAAAYERRLGAHTWILKDRGHFNAEREPAVLEAVTAALDRSGT